MQICRELAGFSYGQADNVRRAMSKKKHKVMEEERAHFIYGCKEPGRECPGCVANGIPEQVANEIYDDMVSFASYAFNKSHAACYAYVAFQTAYLKRHYPSEFMAALLTSVLDNTDKVIEYSGECQRLGIRLLPPDINISLGGFTVDGKDIRFGLNAVKNVGRNLIDTVVESRKEKPYTSLYDFCKRMHGAELNRRAVESLIKSGAMDCTGATRRSMLENLEGILKSIENDSRKNLEGQLDLFAALGEEEESRDDYILPRLEEYPLSTLLQMEKEISGLYLSGHPLDAYREQINNYATARIADLIGEDARQYDNKNVTLICTIVKIRQMTTKSSSLMAFVSVEDLTGTMEMILFPKVYLQYRAALGENKVVVIQGRVSCREEEAAKLLAEAVIPLEDYQPGQPAPRQESAPSAGNTPKDLEYWLRVPGRESPQWEKFLHLAAIFDGTTPVYVYFQDTNTRTLTPRSLWITPHPLLEQELRLLLGDKNVVVRQRNNKTT